MELVGVLAELSPPTVARCLPVFPLAPLWSLLCGCVGGGNSPHICRMLTVYIHNIHSIDNLMLSARITERNFLADASKIIEKSKILKGKVDFQKITTVGLRDLGYDASLPIASLWNNTLGLN
ncbi:hypothetical protein KSP40_PGU020504 [Platanthera guangdongensis]|uniref:Uncharacterized protein n=1 Tax=Platanthera guangdongensis TaxID=2320717 RepID=A0ABR2N5H0_9ASPA